MTKMIKLITICFFIFIFAVNLYSEENIKSNLQITYSKDTLDFELKVLNFSDADIYILLDNWAFEGDELSNSFLSYPFSGYLVNTLWYFPKKFTAIRYRTERRDSPVYKYSPTLQKIKKNDSLLVNLSVCIKLEKPDSLLFLSCIPVLFENDIIDLVLYMDFALAKKTFSYCFQKTSENKLSFYNIFKKENLFFNYEKFSDELFKACYFYLETSGVLKPS